MPADVTGDDVGAPEFKRHCPVCGLVQCELDDES